MGQESSRGSQVTKFQEGIDGNHNNAYPNVESDLKFNHSASQALEIPAASHLLRDGSEAFAHSFFIDKMDDLSGFPMIYAESNNPEQGIEIFLSVFTATTVTITLRFIGTIGQDNHTRVIPLSYILNKTHFVAVFRSDLATGSNSETDLYINGALFSTTAAFFSGGCLQELSAFRIGSFPNGTLPFSGSISNYSIFNRALTIIEIEEIYNTVGDIPESARASCIAHYALQERTSLIRPDTLKLISGGSGSNTWIPTAIVKQLSGDFNVTFKMGVNFPNFQGIMNLAETKPTLGVSNINTGLFGLYTNSSNLDLNAREGSTNEFTDSAVIVLDTSILGIKRTGSVIEYQRDGVTFYTSLTANSNDLWLSFTFNQDSGATTDTEAKQYYDIEINGDRVRENWDSFDLCENYKNRFADTVEQYNYAKIYQDVPLDSINTDATIDDSSWEDESIGTSEVIDNLDGTFTLDYIPTGLGGGDCIIKRLPNIAYEIGKTYVAEVDIEELIGATTANLLIVLGSATTATPTLTANTRETFITEHTTASTNANLFLYIGGESAPNLQIKIHRVEIYEKGKKQLSANHARAINFSADELGIVNPSTQLVKKDFYNKGVNNWGGLDFDGIAELATVPDSTDFDFGTADFDLEIDFTHKTQASTAWYFSKRVGIDDNVEIYSNTNTLTIQCKVSGRTAQISAPSALVGGRRYRIIFKKISEDSSNWKIIINGSESSITVIDNELLVADDLTNSAAIAFGSRTTGGIFFKEFNLSRCKIILNGVDKAEWFFNGNTQTTVIDVVNAHIATLQGYSASRLLQGGGAWLEKDTLLPELSHAIDLVEDGVYFQIPNFQMPASSNEKGYTFLFTCVFNEDEFGHGLNATANTTQQSDWFIWHEVASFLSGTTAMGGLRRDTSVGSPVPLAGSLFIYQAGASPTQPSFDLSQSATLNKVSEIVGIIDTIEGELRMYFDGVLVKTHVLIAESGYLETLGRMLVNYSDYEKANGGKKLIRSGIYNGVLQPTEIKRLNNNGNLSHPTLDDDWVMYHCYGGGYSENGTDVLLKDLTGNGNDFEVINLTGATSADKLTDVPDRIFNLNLYK